MPAWDPADGPAPPLEARAAFAAYTDKSRCASARTVRGAFTGPDLSTKEKYSSGGGKDMSGYSVVETEVESDSDDKKKAQKVLVVNTEVWNDVWAVFFEDDAAIDAVFTMANHDGRAGHPRCVLLRLTRAAAASGGGGGDGAAADDAQQQQQQQTAAIAAIEKQARSCGPVEFTRVVKSNNATEGTEKIEIYVQFTCESNAKLFLGTCKPPDQGVSVSSLSSSTAAAAVGGVYARIASGELLGSAAAAAPWELKALVVPAQRLANNPEMRLTLKPAPPAVADGDIAGVRIADSYIKALFDAAGASEVRRFPPAPAPATTTTAAEKKKAAAAAPAAEHFSIRFGTYHELLVTLHTLQFPLRHLFGLELAPHVQPQQPPQQTATTTTTPAKEDEQPSSAEESSTEPVKV